MTDAQYFLLRRIHSFLGVFPLSIFLINHLLTNSTGIISADFFEHKVALLHALGPLLPIVEAVFIFIPLALHIALGIYIATQSRTELGACASYARNWAFILQRATGWLALLFIIYHVVHLRFLHDMEAIPFSIVLAEMFTVGPWAYLIVPAYFIGGIAVIYHMANGLCTFCMSWGITVGPASQRYMAYFATLVGIGLTVLLLTSIVAYMRIGLSEEFLDPVLREQLIQRLLEYHQH